MLLAIQSVNLGTPALIIAFLQEQDPGPQHSYLLHTEL